MLTGVLRAAWRLVKTRYLGGMHQLIPYKSVKCFLMFMFVVVYQHIKVKFRILSGYLGLLRGLS